MIGRRPFRSFRARLTLWIAAVIAGVVLLYGGAIYLLAREGIYEELDRQLAEDLRRSVEALPLPLPLGEVDYDQWRVEALGAPAFGLEIWSGQSLVFHLPMPGGTAPLPRRPAPSGPGETHVETIWGPKGVPFRVHSALQPAAGAAPLEIRVARSEEDLRHELGELLIGVVMGLPAAVLLACIGAYFLAGRALIPVSEMATRAKTITAERLSQRLPIENPDDELGRLGSVFNETLARLEKSFESLRRFTADAAHELRTPLTALRSVGEVALRESGSEPVDRDVVGSMLEEVDRLAGLVEALLTLSRADGGRMELHLEPLELVGLASELTEYLEALAAERGQRFVVEGERPVHVLVDTRLMRQAVLNLLHNAVKFSPEGEEVRLTIRRTGDEALLEIIDRGPGVAPEERGRIFERFYRVDKARSRERGGAGLGLSITEWAVGANGGSIEVDDAPGRGSCFRIRLPLLPQGDSARQAV